jgi:hypothetical protein
MRGIVAPSGASSRASGAVMPLVSSRAPRACVASSTGSRSGAARSLADRRAIRDCRTPSRRFPPRSRAGDDACDDPDRPPPSCARATAPRAHAPGRPPRDRSPPARRGGAGGEHRPAALRPRRPLAGRDRRDRSRAHAYGRRGLWAVRGLRRADPDRAPRRYASETSGAVGGSRAPWPGPGQSGNEA